MGVQPMNFLIPELAKTNSNAGIRVSGISKSFNGVHALTDVDLVVEPGTVVALLGPNGAGKTTLVRILTTLLTPDGGTAEVAGFDVTKNADALRSHIGLAGQNAAVDENLTGRENLELVGRLYHLGRAKSKARAEELLEEFDLTDAADRRVKTYSGGMRRRLDLGASLVARPEVLFFDEPTTGLDPRSRQALWDEIEKLVAEGTTILLTTQYMEEADRLADTIAVIDRGRIVAQGTARELKEKIGGDMIEVTVADKTKTPAAARVLMDISLTLPEMNIEEGKVTLPVAGSAAALAGVIRRLDAAGIEVADVAHHRPTLDDVFLRLTGHAATEEKI